MSRPVNVKQVALYLAPEEKATLDRLHALTRAPRNVLLREAVGDLFTKYQALLTAQAQQKRSKR